MTSTNRSVNQPHVTLALTFNAQQSKIRCPGGVNLYESATGLYNSIVPLAQTFCRLVTLMCPRPFLCKIALASIQMPSKTSKCPCQGYRCAAISSTCCPSLKLIAAYYKRVGGYVVRIKQKFTWQNLSPQTSGYKSDFSLIKNLVCCFFLNIFVINSY